MEWQQCLSRARVRSQKPLQTYKTNMLAIIKKGRWIKSWWGHFFSWIQWLFSWLTAVMLLTWWSTCRHGSMQYVIAVVSGKSMGVFNTSLLKDDSSWKLKKINLLMLEEIVIVSSKSGFDWCIHDRVISMMRKKCRRTDGQTAFQLYIVD